MPDKKQQPVPDFMKDPEKLRAVLSSPEVRQLAAEGRIDGIEIDHPRNSEEDKAECHALCARYNLIVTGGTDFHGSNTAHPHPVGTCTTADGQIARIDALAKEYQK